MCMGEALLAGFAVGVATTEEISYCSELETVMMKTASHVPTVSVALSDAGTDLI